MVQRQDSGRVPVVVLGLGEVGRAVARAAAATAELELVGTVDPAHAGRRLRELLDATEVPDLEVLGAPKAAYAKARGGVALVATGSRLEALIGDLEAAAAAGLNVVSTCEELAYPRLTYPELADRLERAFRKAQTSCLGTGVNPGFVLDRLPSFLGGVTGPVRHVSATRVVDVATRRPALQLKVGAGLSLDDFSERADAGAIGHVGLMESAALAAEGLGLDVDEVDEALEAVLAEEPFDTGTMRGEAGSLAGIHQIARGFRDGREVVRLELLMAVGAEDPHDAVDLDADPPIRLRIEGGVAGEEATAWAVVDAAALVAGAEPGLMTVLDLPSGR